MNGMPLLGKYLAAVFGINGRLYLNFLVIKKYYMTKMCICAKM